MTTGPDVDVSTMLSRSLSVLLVALLSLSTFVSLSGTQTTAGVAGDGAVDDGRGLGYAYHKLTEPEMRALRAAIGVMDPTADYNVQVDGYGTGLSPPSETAWEAMVGELNVVDSVDIAAEDLPASMDLSVLPTFPTIGNQSAQPSCAAWAATYYSYGFLEAEDNGWDGASAGDPSQLLSPAWTYSRSNGGRDSGSSMYDNMMVILDWGAATLETMPYDDDVYLPLGSAPAFREAPAHRGAEVFTIQYTGSGIVDELKALVNSGIPVTFAIDANEYTNAFADDNFIVSSAEYSSGSLNHAQTLVGFDDSVQDDGDAGAFRVANSWGPEWGDGGYYWLTYEVLVELGDIGLLVLNYMSDIEDYAPGIVAVWHFDDAPSRSAAIEVGVGQESAPAASRTAYSVPDRTPSHVYPTYMCMDITELGSSYTSESDSFYLDVGFSQFKGVISSFKIEMFSSGFVPGVPSQASGQSPDVPASTPGSVGNVLAYYDSIAFGDALDADVEGFGSDTEVGWVAVDHTYFADGDSMQSGDVGDGESTAFALSVQGPVAVSFEWRVSSEQGNDILSFEVPEAGIFHSMSGDTGWEHFECTLGEGVNNLLWAYSKDADTSALEDTAWLDSLTLTLPPADFSIDSSYSSAVGELLTVTPHDIVNPSGSELTFWYDWGDGTEATTGDPLSGHAASHTYDAAGQFVLQVSMDDDGDNTTRTASVDVVDNNAEPLLVDLEADPVKDVYLPGEGIVFYLTVADGEGDSVTASMEVPDLGLDSSQVSDTEPGEPVTFMFEVVFEEGREEPYTVVFCARDDAEHVESDWPTLSTELTVGSPPVAEVTAYPDEEGTTLSYVMDASGSYDSESPDDALQARWDWDDDGDWDTDWSTDLIVVHEFDEPGTHTVGVELMDGNGQTSITTLDVLVVLEEDIPEFPALLLPVLVVVLLFFVAKNRLGRRAR